MIIFLELKLNNWCISFHLNKKYSAGKSKKRSLKNEILGSSLIKSPKQPQSVTRIFVALYSPHVENLKKVESIGTYPVRKVYPVSTVKNITNRKNNQDVNFFRSPMISMIPKTISKIIIQIANTSEYLEKNGKTGAKKLNGESVKAALNSTK